MLHRDLLKCYQCVHSCENIVFAFMLTIIMSSMRTYASVLIRFIAADATSGNYQSIVLDSDTQTPRHMTQLVNGALRIYIAQDGDHGYYLCHASNGVGIGISKVVFLRVHGK